MMNEIRENALIESLVRSFPRSPLQINDLQESDAELVQLPGTELLLAATTDSIVEEIETGLYTDPYLIGWMTVMINASDLAAVGAEPIGILIEETLPLRADETFTGGLQAGIGDACTLCGMPVLGGDTNFSTRMQMGGCAIGFVAKGSELKRTGARPGDRLFASGRLGLGSAFAFAQLTASSSEKRVRVAYRPQARLKEGQALRGVSSTCMDTSDGCLATLDQLARLNSVGFAIDLPLVELIHPEALDMARSAGVPLWFMLAGPHGEFELLFTVAEEDVERMTDSAVRIGWRPLSLGRVAEGRGVTLTTDGGSASLDTGRIRNLMSGVAGDVERFIRELFRIDAEDGPFR